MSIVRALMGGLLCVSVCFRALAVDGGPQLNVCYVDATVSCLDAVLSEGNKNGWNLSCGDCVIRPEISETIEWCTGGASQAYIANGDLSIPYAQPYPSSPYGTIQGRVATVSGSQQVCGVIVDCEFTCTNSICDREINSDLNIAKKYADGNICWVDAGF